VVPLYLQAAAAGAAAAKMLRGAAQQRQLSDGCRCSVQYERGTISSTAWQPLLLLLRIHVIIDRECCSISCAVRHETPPYYLR